MRDAPDVPTIVIKAVGSDYEEVTVRPDFEGKMRDVEDGLDSMNEILEEVGEAQLKKAGGGLAYMLGE